MWPKFTPKTGPRKSNAGTPVPGDSDASNQPTLAERLSFYDAPRPFRNPHFVSRLGERTATASTSNVKKNVKQILTLERERVSGGDGFLSAAQTAAKARGEPIDVGKKKKNPPGMNRPKGWNLKGRRSGVGTPMTMESGSGSGTPAREEDDEEEDEESAAAAAAALGGPEEPKQEQDNGEPRKEIITYHTPAAPPSLLPPKKYCDITGLHAAYTDPRTKLRYKGLEVWQVVRSLGPGGDQAYLALRGAQTSLK
ncbi:chromatin-remodeling complex subunit ies6 [Saitozyma podzolica]|uniref:Chromatin-remodeling complex subunit ies6 n=1 Tax=Saitozyma podzolica TaxID=1890683 RepID=A0A427Y8S8_9TREE|nr:chromatin-remodeling complex subunit ies6 [Saitozyma podzolica]